MFNKKNNICIPKKVINLYISYTLGRKLRNSNTDFTLSNCSFGYVKLTKNANIDKYKYTSYGIGFDSRSDFIFTDAVDLSLSVHVNNKGKNILILGEGPAQGLDDTTLAAEAKYSINFTQSGKGFYTVMEATVFCLLMV